MSSERKDEFLSWRGRLDSPEGVPGQGLDDHEQTWERLSDRLREKPRRRLSVYGIVAACLLLAVIPASRFFQDRKPANRSEKRATVAPLVVRPDNGRNVYTSAAPAARPVPSAAEPGRRETWTLVRSGGRSKPIIRVDMKTVAVTDDSLHMPVASAVPLVSQLPPAGPVPQKKWKVVDLNELNSGWQPPRATAFNFLPGSLHIGPGKPEPFTAGGPAPDKPAIRIRLSP
ncbi:MAG TPA: hypothetical protein VGQ51_05200 [Puia sp.]|jgi:hypothetical protein|nr:hypothetical protein [Puia sp.]